MTTVSLNCTLCLLLISASNQVKTGNITPAEDHFSIKIEGIFTNTLSTVNASFLDKVMEMSWKPTDAESIVNI